jgi:amino acid adenylation domain-containing protein
VRFLLPHSVDHAAERFAERPAFRFLDATLTYAQLAKRTNQLAWVLVEEGVKRGDRVGILMHKSVESPLAVHGIMKAGAAYVPLDPGAPLGRLRTIIRHCGIRCLVTHAHKQQQVEKLSRENNGPQCVIGLDEAGASGIRCVGWGEIASAPGDAAPRTGLMEQDLAYIMYTSGSTGVPKGIMHTHASGLSYARAAADTYGINQHDRLGNHSPLHFDMSTLDYFSAPLRGACTVIFPEAYTKLPASLSTLMEKERLTIWYSVPFALIQLLLHGLLEERDLGSLRWVLFGGEPFPAKYLHALRHVWPQARFSNVYGPAEVNQCTYYHIPQDAPDNDEPPPIGRVWQNAEGLVVDERDRQVASGEPGELLIRAPTMMRGYWDAAQINSEAFFERPAAGGCSDRFYRTGDLVLEREDGNMVFLGRKDRQIKVRGYRVELDEIESVLTAHACVEEAAVYSVPGSADAESIEAAVIPVDAPADLENQLRRHCAQHLPNYALPETLRLVASFPRTTSGKIDRRSLRNGALEHHGAKG